MRKLTVLLLVSLVGTFALGATFFVCVDKQTCKATEEAHALAAWVVKHSLDVPAVEEIPGGLRQTFLSAMAIQNMAVKAGKDPNPIALRDCVEAAMTEENIPACIWKETTPTNICESHQTMTAWGQQTCARIGRPLGGAGVNPEGTKGRVACAGEPLIKIRVRC